MIKVKHARTADCVVAGFRWHKSGERQPSARCCSASTTTRRLQHVGVTSSFTMAMRKQLAAELAPLRENALDGHPWRDWAEAPAASRRACPAAQSRWSAGKDLSWEPLRIERVCEVKYDHLQGDRFRHAAIFLRWRPDKPPARLPLRPARGHDALRAREGLRRRSAAAIAVCQSSVSGSSSGSSASCAGRSASGTCCRLTRMRVHVRKRPRIASTSTSAGSRCAAASGWRAFQRSRPASASSLARARPISISGLVLVRRPVGFADAASVVSLDAGRFRGRDDSGVVADLRARDGATRDGSPACLR